MWWLAPLHRKVPTLLQVLQQALVPLFDNKVHKAHTAAEADHEADHEAEHEAERAAAHEAEHEAPLKRKLRQNRNWVKLLA